MVLKFQGRGNTWILKESSSITHSHFAIEPKELERVNLKIEEGPSEIAELPKGVELIDIIRKGDTSFISFEDIVEKKLDDEFGIYSNNIHHYYGETPDLENKNLWFGVAVILDNNEIYVLDGSKQAFIINDNGKTIDKL